MQIEEGDSCSCGGTFEYIPNGECTCHIAPPCSACVNSILKCNKCGMDEEEFIEDLKTYIKIY